MHNGPVPLSKKWVARLDFKQTAEKNYHGKLLKNQQVPQSDSFFPKMAKPKQTL